MQLSFNQVRLLNPVEDSVHENAKGFARVAFPGGDKLGLLFSDGSLQYFNVEDSDDAVKLIASQLDSTGGHMYFDKNGNFHSYVAVRPVLMSWSTLMKVEPPKKRPELSVVPGGKDVT